MKNCRISLLFKIATALSIIVGQIFCATEVFHGTTILNWPYIDRKPNGQFEGFCIDLLNQIASLTGIAYTLSVVPDGKYGGWVSPNGSIDGMIGQIYRKEADFAIGDLTVLSNRARFVDFTIPFLEFGMAALIRREILDRFGPEIQSFKELSEQTAIKYGVKRSGANLPLFHDSPVVAKMYSFMDTHPSVFVDGERDGLHRVKTERYAFIAESTFIEYVVERDCDLVAIDDRRKNFQFSYAIAVAKGSPLKDRFSKAIHLLKSNGSIAELRNKYWIYSQRNCPGDPNFRPSANITLPHIEFRDHSSRSNSEYNRYLNQYRSPPHDSVSDEDVELIKPRPDRRPISRRPMNRRNSASRNRQYYNFILFTAFVHFLSNCLYCLL
ncbi:hypothetical protein NH340_JMT06820 [Sarcoptes scabiei]|nr:hypothetical protein NH340_JMT06820 [Sarcoptes scabiei]